MVAPRKLRETLGYSAVGLEMGLAVCVGLIAGGFADDYLGTAPLLGLVGLLLGVAAGFRSLIRAAKRMQAAVTVSPDPPADPHPDPPAGPDRSDAPPPRK